MKIKKRSKEKCGKNEREKCNECWKAAKCLELCGSGFIFVSERPYWDV